MNLKQLFSFLFLFICSLSFSLQCFGQKYQPMAIEGAHWIVEHDSESTPWGSDRIFSFTIRGDSIGQGKTYKKVYTEYFRKEGMSHFPRPYEVTHSLLFALIRDEPLEQKVYVIYEYSEPYNCVPHTETVLYDFSLTKGEEFMGCSYEMFINPFQPIPLVVNSVSLINHQGEDRKVLHTEGVFPVDELPILEPINFIEGIGIQDWGIFFMPFSPGSGFSGLIDYCIGSDADCGIITNIEENLSKQGFSIYPTLIQDYSFWIENNLPNISLHIYNLMGREVATSLDIHSSKQLIKLDDSLGKGMYIVKIVDSQNQLIGTERIILH